MAGFICHEDEGMRVTFGGRGSTSVKFKCYFSWQGQYLVKVKCHFLWQVQHLVNV